MTQRFYKPVSDRVQAVQIRTATAHELGEIAFWVTNHGGMAVIASPLLWVNNRPAGVGDWILNDADGFRVVADEKFKTGYALDQLDPKTKLNGRDATTANAASNQPSPG